jgi:hypothetical protein
LEERRAIIVDTGSVEKENQEAISGCALHKITGTMVEKVVDNGAEDTVLVEAFSNLSRNHAVFGEQTVGAAIEVFEETLSKGFFV